ncbi:MAG: antibiotic biosynthesis monooxygenase [Nostoc sp.]
MNGFKWLCIISFGQGSPTQSPSIIQSSKGHLMKNEPGFIDTKLHRSLDPTERFQFINIAKWSSKEAWKSAFSKRISQNEIFEQQLPVEPNPALYQIEAEY